MIARVCARGWVGVRGRVRLASMAADAPRLRRESVRLDVREFVQAARAPGPEADDLPAGEEALLADIWETRRPSCLKRSTIGSWLLRTLEARLPADLRELTTEALTELAVLHAVQAHYHRQQAILRQHT